MENEIVDFTACTRGQINDVYIAGKHDNKCQVLLGNSTYYTQLCDVPRRVGEASIVQVQRYCKDLAVPAYLHELTSPGFPIAVFSTIVVYFFLRYLVRLASGPRTTPENSHKASSKRELRFPQI